MEVLFAAAAMKIVQGEEIPHWNLITFGDVEMKSEMEEEARKLSQEHDLSSLQNLESVWNRRILLKWPIYLYVK